MTNGGKFEIYNDKGSKFRFRLKASSGEIIAVGEAYESKAITKNGVESVQKNAAGAAVVDPTEKPQILFVRAEQKPSRPSRGVPRRPRRRPLPLVWLPRSWQP